MATQGYWDELYKKIEEMDDVEFKRIIEECENNPLPFLIKGEEE